MAVSAAFGAFPSWWVLLCLPVTVLVGLAFTVPIFAFSAKQESDGGFNILFRFVITPLFLFSGTFFPIEQLPAVLRPVAWLTPLWHGVDANRELALGSPDFARVGLHVLFLLAFVGGRRLAGATGLPGEAGRMTTRTRLSAAPPPPGCRGSRGCCRYRPAPAWPGSWWSATSWRSGTAGSRSSPASPSRCSTSSRSASAWAR